MKLAITSLTVLAIMLVTVAIALAIIWHLTGWPISGQNLQFGVWTGVSVGIVIAGAALLIKQRAAPPAKSIAAIGIAEILFGLVFYYIIGSWVAV